MPYTIALAGNPNCGKTTLFNALTGSEQYVGNFPGVTVEKKSGKVSISGTEAVVTDLPGIYSLSPYTPEEVVAREYIIFEKPDLIVNVVDATGLERSLYLTVQLAELGIPVMLALNMTDILNKYGLKLDLQRLTEATGIPAVAISAAKGNGINELLKEMSRILAKGHGASNRCKLLDGIYPWKIDSVLKEMEKLILSEYKGSGRFVAVKLFENDDIYLKQLKSDSVLNKKIKELMSFVKETETVDRHLMIAECRYRRAKAVASDCISEAPHLKKSLTDRIDRVLLNRFLAFPILLAVMAAVFTLTFGTVGNYLSDVCEGFINSVSDVVYSFLTDCGAAEWTVSLICDGIFAGVGSVLSFVPQITVLFTMLSLLEDSGYMARAAFIMDRLLRPFGLSGKSFVPMLMGFGCTVPAVMAARTLENGRGRTATVLITPFMSCSAKMPVYAMIISEFFGKYSPPVIFSVYLFGIVFAVIAAWVITGFGARERESAFLLEIPEYRIPTLKSLTIHVWLRVKGFIIKAGTVLLIAGIVIWFLQSFGSDFHFVGDNAENSFLAHIGRAVAPVFRPLGFGSWQISVSLLSGLIAKESVVSSLNIVSPSGIAGLLDTASALSLTVFVLFYTPCVAAMTAIFKELKSVKLTVFTAVMHICIAWVMSFAVYSIVKLMI